MKTKRTLRRDEAGLYGLPLASVGSISGVATRAKPEVLFPTRSVPRWRSPVAHGIIGRTHAADSPRFVPMVERMAKRGGEHE